MAADPAFASTPRCTIGQVSVANTNRDGTGTIATIFSAGAVRLFIHDGTNARLIREVLVAAVTPSTTVEAFSADVDFSGPDQALVLPAGYSLRASTHNAETFNVLAFGGDY